MADNPVMIPEVRKGQAHWTVKVTIIEELPDFVSPQTGTRYKRYVLTDDQGNTIPPVVYGKQIQVFGRTLRLHGVYCISNASIKLPIGPPMPTNYLHWRETIITKMPHETATLNYFLDSLTPICMLGSFAENEYPSVDIMAVVVKAYEPEPISTRIGFGKIQRFIPVNTERIRVTLSIWDQQVDKTGPALTAAAASYSVVVAKRVNASIYHGLAVSAHNGSSFMIDPPLPAATALRAWFDTVREVELPHLLEDYSVSYAKDLVDRNIIRKHSVDQIQSSLQSGDFWTRSFLQLYEGEQRFYYIGCSNCFTRVDSRPGYNYHCQLCDKPDVASIRPRVSMDVYDSSGRITVGAIETVAEEILQCTGTRLEELVKQGITCEVEPIKKEFQDNMYLVLLRRKYSTHSDAQKRLLLVAYFDDTVPDDTVEPPAPASQACVLHLVHRLKIAFHPQNCQLLHQLTPQPMKIAFLGICMHMDVLYSSHLYIP